MKTSSARQLELDYSGGETLQARGRIDFASDAANARRGDVSSEIASSTSVQSLPTFDRYSQMYALKSRMAGRINAAGISDEEHQVLLRERQRLLDKKLAGEISAKESNRLEYVRWSLDRIEDAKYGQALDILEGSVAKY